MQKSAWFFLAVCLFAYVIFVNEEQPSEKKLQSNASQVKQRPHAKIQLFLALSKKG